MKHASTRAVFNYWNERRGNRPAPARGDIDPVAIRHALGDTFMLSTDFVDQLRFRLAGTRICALFCREIKGEILTDLWAEKSRKPIEDILAIVTGEAGAAVCRIDRPCRRRRDASIWKCYCCRSPAIGDHARTGMLGVLAPTTPVLLDRRKADRRT